MSTSIVSPSTTEIIVALISSAVGVVGAGGEPGRQAVASTAMQRSIRCICSVLSPIVAAIRCSFERPPTVREWRPSFHRTRHRHRRHVHRYFHVVGASVWVSDAPHSSDWSAHFLGMLGDEACWGVDVPHGEDPADGAAVDLRSFFGRAGEVEWLVAGRAVQLVEWARTAPVLRAMRHADRAAAGRAGDAVPGMWPVGVSAHRAGDDHVGDPWRQGAAGPRCAVPGSDVQLPGRLRRARRVAGGCRVREVREEVGIEVDNVRYWGSQPWPFPHSLMVGFMAEWTLGRDRDRPSRDRRRQWFSRDELRSIPPPISIARKLIDAWLADT